ncbi:MAG: hypothetical protein ACOYOS_15865 [Syntrophales bacterium]
MNAIREHDQYSFRNTIRAGCIRECWLFFQRLGKGPNSEQVRRDLADGALLGNYAFSTRMALWKIFRTRYLNIADPWVQSELIKASQGGPESPEFVFSTIFPQQIRMRQSIKRKSGRPSKTTRPMS